MAILREVLAKFGIEADGAQLLRLDKTIEGTVANLTRLGAAMLGGAAAIGLTKFAVNMARTGDEIATTAERLNLSTDALQRWQYVAALSDVENSELLAGFKFLNKAIYETTQGGAEMSAVFAQLGVQVKNVDGSTRNVDELLPEIADGFATLRSHSDRTGIALKLFGRAGDRMIPLLGKGARGIRELAEEFVALGGGIDNETIRASEALDDELKRLDASIVPLKARLASVLIPFVTRAAEVFTKFAAATAKMLKGTKVVKISLTILSAAAIAFGIKFAIGFAGPILIVGAFVLAIGSVILIVDDLITLFEGGQSVIGDFIDEMLGAGTAADVVRYLTEAWEGLLLTVRDTAKAVGEFFGEEAPAAAPRKTDTSAADRAAARAGRRVRYPGETVEDAERRFARGQDALRPGARGNAPASPTARVRAPRGAERVATLRAAQQSRVEPQRVANVSSSTTINVPPGTSREQLAAIERVVNQVNARRNREAVAALSAETVTE